MTKNPTMLSGRRILLTGGTTGIGRAALKALANEGARVLTFGRHQDALDAALSGIDGEVIGIVEDAATHDGIDRVFAAVDDRLGGIDMLVACAALGAQPIHEMAEEDWRYVIDANLTGYLACARAAILRMQDQGGGHLLFVGSISTEIKAAGESVYAATKAGIQAFAETLRKEVADKRIRVSVIQPGSVDTEMQKCSAEEKQTAVAEGRMLPAKDVADAILFVLGRSANCDIVNLRIEPLIQKTA
ncbi:MAG TPA: SDR family oxidoreductase [Sphingomonas sanguinis]|uniref:SDR family oxidoreductase n=1 Tax=Sphingomonas sanguinis TaxID=33051 RepID=UPI002ABF11D2|nr:SDR family oxidoreductase [Sphingomonas sanguinis]